MVIASLSLPGFPKEPLIAALLLRKVQGIVIKVIISFHLTTNPPTIEDDALTESA